MIGFNVKYAVNAWRYSIKHKSKRSTMSNGQLLTEFWQSDLRFYSAFIPAWGVK